MKRLFFDLRGTMKLVWLCRYLSGLMALLTVMASLITYAPPVRHLAVVLPLLFGVISVFIAVLSLFLQRLAPDHWIHRSRFVAAFFIAAATTVTVFAVLVG